MTDEHVVLELPDSVHDADRVIPQDLIEFGQTARNWFCWDLEQKQPRAPFNDGYAGTVKWGRDSVSWDNRVGGRFGDVMEALNGTVNGHVDPTWYWGMTDNGEAVEPHPLYPMVIVPHADFQPDDGPLMLVDLDDVIDVQDDGTGVMTREVWDIIQSLGGYAELSRSMTGAHVFVKGRIPGDVDGREIMEDLNDGGQVEIYGYPANGRVIGTTWLHIEDTPRHAVPEAQDVIDELVDEYVDDEDQLSDQEQADAVIERYTSQIRGGQSSSSRSKYYDLDPVPIANTGPFRKYGKNGQGPHPVHGATTSHDNPGPDDKDSTNFGVDSQNGWKCWAHDDGGGALQLIAVLEGIRDCGSAADVMQDPEDALRVCLAARDEYSSDLDDAAPPTVALKGVCTVQNLDFPDDGPLDSGTYEIARGLFDAMNFSSRDEEERW
ncbi:hypothetical protein EGH21_21955 [Halomicroarcula sp. F13]|uniref:DNA primase/polymerase bifunctional N-terminal domain-containing protein n=1 Tax=Haloarcula rubra TaxID=2487747 RepID=A0AAW4PYR5_9EURY|nr:hypothetical protein [Halomicroarcula rubra]MBX0325685.1 hypothetical protein [Halomicroarcula rubra]